MDLSKITDKAKELLESRGGTDALKEDVEELREIAKGEGSLADKAKAALEALKDPGAAGEDVAVNQEGTPPPPAKNQEGPTPTP